jgi:hypothetical protein
MQSRGPRRTQGPCNRVPRALIGLTGELAAAAGGSLQRLQSQWKANIKVAQLMAPMQTCLRQVSMENMTDEQLVHTFSECWDRAKDTPALTVSRFRHLPRPNQPNVLSCSGSRNRLATAKSCAGGTSMK